MLWMLCFGGYCTGLCPLGFYFRMSGRGRGRGKGRGRGAGPAGRGAGQNDNDNGPGLVDLSSKKFKNAVAKAATDAFTKSMPQMAAQLAAHQEALRQEKEKEKNREEEAMDDVVDEHVETLSTGESVDSEVIIQPRKRAKNNASKTVASDVGNDDIMIEDVSLQHSDFSLDNTNLIPNVPLDFDVSVAQKKLIVNHKYIDFNTLTPKLDKPKNNSQIELKKNSRGWVFNEVEKNNNDNRELVDFDTWLRQFNIFATVLVKARPNLAVGLFKYLDIIRKQRNKGVDWYQYDQLFRKLRQSNPAVYKFENEVFVLVDQCKPESTPSYQTSQFKQPRKPSSTVTSASQYPNNPPYYPDPNLGPVTNDKPFPKSTCWKYNDGEFCAGCTWRDGHRCCWCRSSHPGSRCPNHSSSSQSRSNQSNQSRSRSSQSGQRSGSSQHGGDQRPRNN